MQYSIPFITKLEYTRSIIHYTGKNFTSGLILAVFSKMLNIKHIIHPEAP